MADTKAKFYHILEILWDTDEEHPRTAMQIGELLDARYGIAAERKSICRDISILRDECGFDINLSADNKTGFYLASRSFEDWELKFLIDAVLSPSSVRDRLVKMLKTTLAQYEPIDDSPSNEEG